MAKMRGGSLDSRDSSVGSQIPRRSKLPPHSPDVIVKHTISVDDPAHILIQHKEERRRNFNSLVRRYKHQILYGCENPNCRMPTCLNYQKRVSEGPFRPYTELSARTLACYLASQDNPEKALCRNPPRPTSDFSPTRQAPHLEYRAYSAGRKPHQSEHTENEAHAESHRPSSSISTAPPAQENVRHSSRDSQLSGLSRTKDPKSFTQNLFDTLSLRMVEWLPLRQTTTDASDYATPISVRSYKSQAHPADSKERDSNDTPRRTHTHTASNPSSEPTTPSNRPKRRSNSNLDRKSTSQTLKRVTLEETDTWRPTPRSGTEIKSRDGRSTTSRTVPSKTYSQHHIPTPPPALKHRAPKASKTSNDPTTKLPKQSRRVSWDGSKLLRESAELSDVNDETTEKETPALSSEVLDLKPPSIHNISYPATSVDTVSHLNADIVDGLSQLLADNEEDAQKWKEELEYMNIQGKSENHKWRYATLRQREVFPFVAQSVFYGLNSSRQLTKSFRRKRPLSQHSRKPSDSITVDLHTLESTLRKIQDICPGDLVLNSLWNSLEQLFMPPRDMPVGVRASRRVSYIQPDNLTPDASQSSPSYEPLSDADAAHMLTVVFFALITFLPKVDGQTWRGIQQIREAGTVLPEAQMQKLDAKSTALVVSVTDKLEHDLALRLVHRLVRALTARLAFYEISKTKALPSVDVKKRRDRSVLDLLYDNLREHHESLKKAAEGDGQTVAIDTPVAAAMIVEWIRTLFLKEWDGKPEIPRSEAAGGAIQILSSMYKNRHRLGLEAEAFYTSFLAERLDAMEMPVEWLSRTSNNRTMHLLSFTFLFRPAALVKYFRAINYAAMSKAYEAGMITQRQASRTAFNRTIQIADEINLLARLHTSMNQYFVISVRREHILQDAFNQIWRRERRELLRPLKVKMGTDLGEEGVDLGGVQQEFMTLAFAEALNPEHGMFTVDPITRMAWFQPCSPESLEHFELVGILMSLAVYNGLTIPVTFPVALYRKLLDLRIKRTEHIRDGWPDLAKGLESLLTWNDGDVEDVFVRSYEFSFEAFGSVQTVNMERVDRDAEWPIIERVPSRERRRSSVSNYSSGIQEDNVAGNEASEEQAESDIGSFQTGILKGADYKTSLNTFTPREDTEESNLVTNANREQYVKDYLFWLTDKSIRPQYEAFARGFFTCIDRSSLALFTPEILQTVIEGTQEIDIEELQRHATYDGGWDGKHPLIIAFWNIVKKYSPEQKARLLEFVTASDRVPVSGISSINFVIQRNGSGNDRLPTSYTCYGRLLLPEYTNVTALGLNLDMALKNSRGFGNF
ncbi:HECT domain protein [Talaromyces marneffei ATCC 18224]|uniref:HECT-type E3 ubiquitin transferase n=2 Tax=Talaromyces marneffei TaxID=37727 RepID=B6Q553_TALMQ|nr:HECT domain protein [Talaromyces marneffei ATCC 18224]